MKQIVLTICLFITLNAHAQKGAAVKGKLLEGNTPLEFVNITLTAPKDTVTVLHFANTDSKGIFILDKIPLGEYRLSARMIGYKTISATLFLSGENL